MPTTTIATPVTRPIPELLPNPARCQKKGRLPCCKPTSTGYPPSQQHSGSLSTCNQSAPIQCRRTGLSILIFVTRLFTVGCGRPTSLVCLYKVARANLNRSNRGRCTKAKAKAHANANANANPNPNTNFLMPQPRILFFLLFFI